MQRLLTHRLELNVFECTEWKSEIDIPEGWEVVSELCQTVYNDPRPYVVISYLIQKKVLKSALTRKYSSGACDFA